MIGNSSEAGRGLSPLVLSRRERPLLAGKYISGVAVIKKQAHSLVKMKHVEGCAFHTIQDCSRTI